MSPAEFRTHLIALKFIERDEMERAGICPDTAARMMRDPILTFKAMSEGERKRFWPLVEQMVEQMSPRAHHERTECAQILAGEISRYIDPTDGSHP